MTTNAQTGRSLLGDEVERIARTVFPELEGARLVIVGRRCGDVRDVLAGIDVSTVTKAEAAKIRELYRAHLVTGPAFEELSGLAAI